MTFDFKFVSKTLWTYSYKWPVGSTIKGQEGANKRPNRVSYNTGGDIIEEKLWGYITCLNPYSVSIYLNSFVC